MYKVSQSEVLIKIVIYYNNHIVIVYTTISHYLVSINKYIYTSYADMN